MLLLTEWLIIDNFIDCTENMRVQAIKNQKWFFADVPDSSHPAAIQLSPQQQPTHSFSLLECAFMADVNVHKLTL